MAEVCVRGLTLSVSQDLVTEQCCSCGTVFAMTTEFRQQCLDNPGINKGKSFFCPAGHRQWYTGETAADKLRRERDVLKQQLAQKDDEIKWQRDAKERAREEAKHERARANGYKGHATRITKRAKAGICPCCKRHFTALERHMATKHPTFTPMALEVIDGGKAA